MGDLSEWSFSLTLLIHTKYPPELNCARRWCGKGQMSDAEACILYLVAYKRRMDECGCLKAEVLAFWISLKNKNQKM